MCNFQRANKELKIRKQEKSTKTKKTFIGWNQKSICGTKRSQIWTLVNLIEMQFGFMPETVDAIFIVRRMQKEYQKKHKKLYVFC